MRSTSFLIAFTSSASKYFFIARYLSSEIKFPQNLHFSPGLCKCIPASKYTYSSPTGSSTIDFSSLIKPSTLLTSFKKSSGLLNKSYDIIPTLSVISIYKVSFASFTSVSDIILASPILSFIEFLLYVRLSSISFLSYKRLISLAASLRNLPSLLFKVTI